MNSAFNNMACAEMMVHKSIDSIMLQPKITLADEPSVVDWVNRTCNRLNALPNNRLHDIIDAKEEGWQFAQIMQLKKSGMIRDFKVDCDESRSKLFILIQPLIESRLIEMSIAVGDESHVKGN